jgi:hypothetical protein
MSARDVASSIVLGFEALIPPILVNRLLCDD